MLPAHNLLRTLRSDLEKVIRESPEDVVLGAFALVVNSRLGDLGWIQAEPIDWRRLGSKTPKEGPVLGWGFDRRELISVQCSPVRSSPASAFRSCATFGTVEGYLDFSHIAANLTRAARAVFLATGQPDSPPLTADLIGDWLVVLLGLAIEVPDAFRFRPTVLVEAFDPADQRRAEMAVRERWGAVADALEGENTPPQAVYVFALDDDLRAASIEVVDYLLSLPVDTSVETGGHSWPFGDWTPTSKRHLLNALGWKGNKLTKLDQLVNSGAVLLRAMPGKIGHNGWEARVVRPETAFKNWPAT